MTTAARTTLSKEQMKSLTYIPLKQYVKDNGLPKYAGPFKKEGQTWYSLYFQKKDRFVKFSSNLGILTPDELKSMAYTLQVCIYPSGSHILCKEGEDSWEELDLFQ